MTVRRKRRSFLKSKKPVGSPKFSPGDTVGEFTIAEYLGHSYVNKRTNHEMSKAQHWYTCICSCGTKERRSQQELIDTRRHQECYECRAKLIN